MDSNIHIAPFLDTFSIGFCYVREEYFEYNKLIEKWFFQKDWTPVRLSECLRKWAADGEFFQRTDGFLWKGKILAETGGFTWLVFPWENAESHIATEYENLYAELKSVFAAAYDEIFVTDGEGYTVRVNGACERNYGLKAEQMVGKHVTELVAGGIFSPSATLDVIAQRKQINLVQQTLNGRKLLVTATPVFTQDGKLIRVVSNSRDITELLHLREQLDQLQERVETYEETLKQHEEASGMILSVRSPAMLKVLSKIEKVAKVDSTVLFLGESGVGKTHLARYLHNMSPRKHAPFLSVNCSAFPEALIESELFGYERGAFSGAHEKGKKGLFEAANGGTLFLDEIGELPLPMQAKLLNVLQEKQFFRIGGTTPIQVDVRIIAATNQDLKKKVEEKTFRNDLYYRLNVIPITIPPLRERKEDIVPLAIQFLEEFKDMYGIEKKLSHAAAEELRRANWPGNIRELRNFLERLVVTIDEDTITTKHIATALRDEDETMTEQEHENLSLKKRLELYEGQIIRRMYEECGSTYKLAEKLGISQSSAMRKVNKYVKEL
ncbi:sigma 54-interacting transcriptional regulator [Aneurinibacillus thermoaerophilus]|nr:MULTISPECIES: sigma 54-interacting transcriptional regulator [Aneurinibacillus]MED0678829.1 sigma 54-interacting transcriptional regulator [Aneurinibacillus thermoaerophilus]MED0736702.1 sigma 54-interacting transcriptional regulator [Aneurinibacillus thermoaerophilus]MED0765233.1 sigma 54-interacting transcriptional regulator [Aneurinibacillus thermoaerophilus]